MPGTLLLAGAAGLGLLLLTRKRRLPALATPNITSKRPVVPSPWDKMTPTAQHRVKSSAGREYMVTTYPPDKSDRTFSLAMLKADPKMLVSFIQDKRTGIRSLWMVNAATHAEKVALIKDWGITHTSGMEIDPFGEAD
jgi:hypothetical protein